MDDRELLEYIAAQVGKLTGDMDIIKSKIADVESEVTKTNMSIEHDIKPKINALFDGYKQTYEKLLHIEDEVSKHDEIIYKRVK